MTYDVDAWQGGPNPHPIGGFTIMNHDNQLVHRQTFHRATLITNNELELWAVAAAVVLAQPGDTIRSDSEIIVKWWVPAGACKSRRDLNPLCRIAHAGIEQKHLTLEWVPRHANLAGLFNEQHPVLAHL